MSSIAYVVTLAYREGDIVNNGAQIAGVFENILDARNELESVFHKCCDKLGIGELNVYSFKSDDSFILTDKEETPNYHYYGEVHMVCPNMSLNIFDDDDERIEHFERIESLKQLIELSENTDEPIELILHLNNNAYTRYSILAYMDYDLNAYVFKIESLSNGTKQVLTEDELFDATKTNIGKALNHGALDYVVYD